MEEFKLMITGDKHFDDYNLMEESINAFLSDLHQTKEIVIISGLSEGANFLGERYAAAKGYEVDEFGESFRVADLLSPELYSKMAVIADACICFWDGKCVITKHIIEKVKTFSAILLIVNYQTVKAKGFHANGQIYNSLSDA